MLEGEVLERRSLRFSEVCFQGVRPGGEGEEIVGRWEFAGHEVLKVEADFVPAHFLVGARGEHSEEAGGFK